MVRRGRPGDARGLREPENRPEAEAGQQEGAALLTQTPQACGAGKTSVQSMAGASPRGASGSPAGRSQLAETREEAILGEKAAWLLCSTRVQVLGAVREERRSQLMQGMPGEGKPGEAWEGQAGPGRQADLCGEQQEEEHPAEAAAGLPSPLPPLEQLRALQLDLEPVNRQARRAYAHLRQKQRQRRKAHLEYRSLLIQGIAGFWGATVSFGFSAQTAAGGGSQQAVGRGGGEVGPSECVGQKCQQDRKSQGAAAPLRETCCGGAGGAEDTPEPA